MNKVALKFKKKGINKVALKLEYVCSYYLLISFKSQASYFTQIVQARWNIYGRTSLLDKC